MTGPQAVFDLLADQLADPDTCWSLGTFGAIAEFMREADEPTRLLRDDPSLAAITERGGIRLLRAAAPQPVASETTVGEGWNQRVALCLPSDLCAMSRRAALTELGPDSAALRPADRLGILFDLGLGCLQVDVCIRTADPALIHQLRSRCGRSVFEPGHGAMGLIMAASPHRVFIGRLGRLEVFQPIPAPDGRSPAGPHTHVLPKLLNRRRTHAAAEPIPTGLVPCAHFYPPHATKDAMGKPRSLDRDRHVAFQRMLERFGDPRLVALKQKITEAVLTGLEPSVVSVPTDRHARASVRVALRQLRAGGDTLPSLAAWIAAHDRAVPTDSDPDELEPPV
jgi:hypothetical protein